MNAKKIDFGRIRDLKKQFEAGHKPREWTAIVTVIVIICNAVGGGLVVE